MDVRRGEIFYIMRSPCVGSEQEAGKLVNDNNKYIAGFTDRFTYGGDYGVTITVETVEE